MWRRHVTVSITTMSAFFAPAHAARVPIALLSTITSTISTNVAPWHVSCVAPEHVDTRVGAVDIRLPWPRTFSQPPCGLRLHLLQIIIKNIFIIFYHESSSTLDLAVLTYRIMYTDGVSIHTMRIWLWSSSHLLLKFSGENVPDICNMPIWIYSW